MHVLALPILLLFYHSPHRDAICIFYLVLRGLDTVEDDPEIDLGIKLKTLREFHRNLYLPGWTFTMCGQKEKDRELLEEFNVVCLRSPLALY